MPTTSRRKNPTVIQRLIESPFEFSFKQVVRIIERTTMYISANNKTFSVNPVARFTPPSSENIRFHANQALSFAPSDISSINIRKYNGNSNQWGIQTNLIGLTGSSGVLPYHYTELVIERNRKKDYSINHFFDLFNHRTTSLFYQASIKYSLPIEFERHKLNSDSPFSADKHSRILLSLIGLGTTGLHNRLYTKDESLLQYSGLFSKKLRTTIGLKQIINNHFSIPVEIKEFIGQWQDLIDDVRTRLPGIKSKNGQNNQLGKSVMLGSKGWFSQGKIRIILGPLTKKQLHTFAPGTTTLKALDEIVKLYLNFEHDYDYVMRIRRSDIPDRIHLTGTKPPVMGWNTWLSPSSNTDCNNDETVDIPVSAHRLR